MNGRFRISIISIPKNSGYLDASWMEAASVSNHRVNWLEWCTLQRRNLNGHLFMYHFSALRRVQGWAGMVLKRRNFIVKKGRRFRLGSKSLREVVCL